MPLVAPVIVNYMPSWWAREYGLALGERLFLDAEYRAATIGEMHRLAHDRFGDIGLGQPDPAPVYCTDDLGNATLPAVFGCEVVFADDQYPANHSLPAEAVAAAEPPADLATTFPMSDVCETEQRAVRLSRRPELVMAGDGTSGCVHVVVLKR